MQGAGDVTFEDDLSTKMGYYSDSRGIARRGRNRESSSLDIQPFGFQEGIAMIIEILALIFCVLVATCYMIANEFNGLSTVVALCAFAGAMAIISRL